LLVHSLPGCSGELPPVLQDWTQCAEPWAVLCWPFLHLCCRPAACPCCTLCGAVGLRGRALAAGCSAGAVAACAPGQGSRQSVLEHGQDQNLPLAACALPHSHGQAAAIGGSCPRLLRCWCSCCCWQCGQAAACLCWHLRMLHAWRAVPGLSSAQHLLLQSCCTLQHLSATAAAAAAAVAAGCWLGPQPCRWR
jgi:hypothetical protein